MNQIKKVNETFLITVLLSIGGSFLLGAFSFIAKNEFIRLVFAQILGILPGIVYLKTSGGTIKERLRLNRIKGSTVILLVLLCYCISPISQFLNALSLIFVKSLIDNVISGVAVKYPPIVGVILIGLVPCIFEEMIYRGIFFNEYRKVNLKKGILLSGLLFGLLHMNWNQFIYAFAMGVIFAVIVEVCNSLYASMIIHFLINTNSMLAAYQQKNAAGVLGQAGTLPMKEDLVKFVSLYWIVALIFAILAYFLLKWIAKNEGRKEQFEMIFSMKKTDSKKQSFVTLPLIAGILICLTVMISVELA